MVALVVFEVGILGVLAMTLQAQKTLLAAAASESASRAVEWLADSLSFAGWGGPGSIETEQGLLRWTREADGLVTVTFQGGPGARATDCRAPDRSSLFPSLPHAVLSRLRSPRDVEPKVDPFRTSIWTRRVR